MYVPSQRPTKVSALRETEIPVSGGSFFLRARSVIAWVGGGVVRWAAQCVSSALMYAQWCDSARAEVISCGWAHTVCTVAKFAAKDQFTAAGVRCARRLCVPVFSDAAAVVARACHARRALTRKCSRHACVRALRVQGGEVLAWGENKTGALGSGDLRQQVTTQRGREGARARARALARGRRPQLGGSGQLCHPLWSCRCALFLVCLGLGGERLVCALLHARAGCVHLCEGVGALGGDGARCLQWVPKMMYSPSLRSHTLLYSPSDAGSPRSDSRLSLALAPPLSPCSVTAQFLPPFPLSRSFLSRLLSALLLAALLFCACLVCV